MISLNGLIVFGILAIVVGKRASDRKWIAYVLVGVIAIVQVCIVLYDMFTLPEPIM